MATRAIIQTQPEEATDSQANPHPAFLHSTSLRMRQICAYLMFKGVSILAILLEDHYFLGSSRNQILILFIRNNCFGLKSIKY